MCLCRRHARGFAGLEALGIGLGRRVGRSNKVSVDVWMGKWRGTGWEHGQNWVMPIWEGRTAMAGGQRKGRRAGGRRHIKSAAGLVRKQLEPFDLGP